MCSFFKKIVAGLILSQVMIGLLGAGVVMANSAAGGSASSKKSATEEFEVSKILVLPGQTAPKFLEEIKNPNAQAPIVKAIIRVVDFAVMLIGSFAFLMMVIGGIVMMTSAGNDQQAEQGKNMLTYSIVGLIVAFSAFIISAFVQSLITGV